MSYRSKDRQTGNLFAELLPFGGKLNPDNRWMKLHDLIPWKELEEIYTVKQCCYAAKNTFPI